VVYHFFGGGWCVRAGDLDGFATEFWSAMCDKSWAVVVFLIVRVGLGEAGGRGGLGTGWGYREERGVWCFCFCGGCLGVWMD